MFVLLHWGLIPCLRTHWVCALSSAPFSLRQGLSKLPGQSLSSQTFRVARIAGLLHQPRQVVCFVVAAAVVMFGL